MSTDKLNDLFEAIEEEVKQLIAERDAAQYESADFRSRLKAFERETNARMEFLRAELMQVKSQLADSQTLYALVRDERDELRRSTMAEQVPVAWLVSLEFGYDGDRHVAIVLDKEMAEQLKKDHPRSEEIEIEELPVFYKGYPPTFKEELELIAYGEHGCPCEHHMEGSVEKVLDTGSMPEARVVERTWTRVLVRGYNHELVWQGFNEAIREAQHHSGPDVTQDDLAIFEGVTDISSWRHE